jgi:hypothetical protein
MYGILLIYRWIIEYICCALIGQDNERGKTVHYRHTKLIFSSVTEHLFWSALNIDRDRGREARSTNRQPSLPYVFMTWSLMNQQV